MVKKIAIVGNGLDLHHGIKSKYQDYYDSNQMPIHLKNVYDIITEKYKDVEVWYDFEEEYRDLIAHELRLMESGYGGSTLGLSDDNKQQLLPRVKLINYLFQTINKLFLQYLVDEYERAKENPDFRIDTVVKQCLETSDIILNFNYTDTLSELYSIDANKIIHVHGSLKDRAIIGHSNYCDYDPITGTSENYGFRMNVPDMRETVYLGDKALQRIEMWNHLSHTSGKFTDTQEIGAGIISEVRLISTTSPISMNMLDYMYSNPFGEFIDEQNGIKYINKLSMDFDDTVHIVVIGHGLQSDDDLLSKIPAKEKKVSVLQRNDVSQKDISKARKLFGTETVGPIQYEWD